MNVNSAHDFWVTQDYEQAVFWFRKTADQGYKFAQSCLGACYQFGKGVPQDYVAAYQWFNLAAVTESFAAEARDKVAKLMTPEQTAEGQRRSSEFKAKPEVPAE